VNTANGHPKALAEFPCGRSAERHFVIVADLPTCLKPKASWTDF